jgi:hypothetical protein
VYEDRVSLSGEVRTRLDVTRGTEETRADSSGEQSVKHRLSPDERERQRELFNTDMNVRTELAHVPVGEEPLRGLPSFELELGPDGRAYAVEPGVQFEPPKIREPELPTAVEAAPLPPLEMEKAEASKEPERAAIDERGFPPALPERPERAEKKPPPEEEPVEGAPQHPRVADAYRAAAQLTTAPGGFADPVDELG